MLTIIFIIIISMCLLPFSKIPKWRKEKKTRGNEKWLWPPVKSEQKALSWSRIEDVMVKLGRNQDSIYGGLLVKTLWQELSFFEI